MVRRFTIVSAQQPDLLCRLFLFHTIYLANLNTLTAEKIKDASRRF